MTSPPASHTSTSRSTRAGLIVVATLAAALVAACSGDAPAEPAPSAGTPSSSSSTSATPTPDSETPTPERARVTGVIVDEVADGFDHPWEVRFLPDGTPLATERPGQVSVVIDGERQVVDGVPGVVARGEGGLMGLVLDPDFAANRRIYLCFTSGSGGSVEDVRVVRFELSEELDALTDATPLVTGLPAGSGNRHQGCRLELGPDGMLWISAGDAVQPSTPQDPDSLGGKVLRATLSGDPAPDNPGGDLNPYVFTWGHRNVQGLAFAADGTPWAVEHGTACDDEINVLESGANYGWDPRGSSYVEQAPMTDPEIDDAVEAAWSTGCPTIAPSGAEFITGEQWGTWIGRLAIAVLKDKELLVATVGGDKVTDTRTELTGEVGRLRTVRTAPDGSLWVSVDADNGALLRLEPEVE